MKPMKAHILGYPRIGERREIKKACEKYWSGKTTQDELLKTGKKQRQHNWKVQKDAGLDLVAVNEFLAFHPLQKLSLILRAIPERFQVLKDLSPVDLYFAMARGYQEDHHDIIPMEMTKWFDTNYHYLVPEFVKNQEFHLFSNKIVDEYREAQSLGVHPKVVIRDPSPTFYWVRKKKKVLTGWT